MSVPYIENKMKIYIAEQQRGYKIGIRVLRWYDFFLVQLIIYCVNEQLSTIL